jgi:hypothetical protein
MEATEEKRLRLNEASENYLAFWRTKDNNLSNPLRAEALKNNFKAGALWQLEESKIDAYLFGFEVYKASNTLNLDDESLFCEYNDWYQKHTNK